LSDSGADGANAVAASSRDTAHGTSGSICLRRVGAGTVNWIADVLSALVTIAAVHVVAERSVHARARRADPGSSHEVACGLIRFVGIGAGAVGGVADVLGAIVPVAAIDAHAKSGRAAATPHATRAANPAPAAASPSNDWRDAAAAWRKWHFGSATQRQQC